MSCLNEHWRLRLKSRPHFAVHIRLQIKNRSSRTCVRVGRSQPLVQGRFSCGPERDQLESCAALSAFCRWHPGHENRGTRISHSDGELTDDGSDRWRKLLLYNGYKEQRFQKRSNRRSGETCADSNRVGALGSVGRWRNQLRT